MRPIALTDKEQVFAYRSDAQTNKYQNWVPRSVLEVEEFIQKTASEMNQPNTWYQMVILKNDDGKLIGDIGLHFIGEEGKYAEFGCTLAKQYQGKGYATEALQAVITFFFDSLAKEKITTSIDPRNVDSIRLVERLGFTKEAYLEKSLFLNGEWVDDVIYVLHNDSA